MALALALGACTQTTYGTGTPVGMQTLQDLAGIADFSSQKKADLNYKPRPALVPPPSGTPLPPPASDQQGVAANWPNDPDAESKRVKEQAAAREKFCADAVNKVNPGCLDPGFRLPQSATASRAPSEILASQAGTTAAQRALGTPAQNAEAVKLFAAAKGQVAVDENGKPIRRYLTDPPPDYRVPDPNAPVVFDNKSTKKKWRWPWEKDTAATDNLSPDTSASTTPKSTNGGT